MGLGWSLGAGFDLARARKIGGISESEEGLERLLLDWGHAHQEFSGLVVDAQVEAVWGPVHAQEELAAVVECHTAPPARREPR